jgi:23S rRNA A2030 N6-methylase RlmJ
MNAGEKSLEQTKCENAKEVKSGVKRIIRQATVEDEMDLVDKAGERNIDHIDQSIIDANYSFRLGDDVK